MTSIEQRVLLLRAAPPFVLVERDILERLARAMADITYSAGQVVIAEGEEADSLFLIVRGRAQVSTKSEREEAPIATLEHGELFGEMALLVPERRRQATVTALTELNVIALGREIFEILVAENPIMAKSMKSIAEIRTRVSFLKRFSPFRSLSPAKIKALLESLETRSLSSGTAVIKQGEIARECYLILSGRMDVITTDGGGSSRKVATLYPGSILGEAALLTDEPRSATVRALDDCQLLVIKRNVLLEIMEKDNQLDAYLLAVLQQRSRPRRAEHVQVQEQQTHDGDTLWILKNQDTGTYVRLSDEGWFVWSRLDGECTLKDLTLDFLSERKELAPDKVAGIVSELAKSGFLSGKNLRPDVVATMSNLSWLQRVQKVARRIMELNLVWSGADPFFSTLYRRIRFLFLRAVQLPLVILAVGGLAVFIALGSRLAPLLHDASVSRPLLIFLVPASLLSIIVHEIGHAVTAKHFRAEVRSAGIGWYWFSPIAFVDTTDMWKAGKWPRVAVSIAGPYADFAMAGAASYLAWVSPSPVAAAALWQFALVSYIGVLVNFNPLLEYDGYFILSDLLNRSNLRRGALEWVGRFLRGGIDRRAELRSHRFDLIYGFASAVYVGVMAYGFVVSYRAILEVHLRSLLPETVASAVPWLVASVVVLSAGITTFGEMRISQFRNPRRSR